MLTWVSKTYYCILVLCKGALARNKASGEELDAFLRSINACRRGWTFSVAVPPRFRDGRRFFLPLLEYLFGTDGGEGLCLEHPGRRVGVTDR